MDRWQHFIEILKTDYRFKDKYRALTIEEVIEIALRADEAFKTQEQRKSKKDVFSLGPK